MNEVMEKLSDGTISGFFVWVCHFMKGIGNNNTDS